MSETTPRQVTRLQCPIGRCTWTYDDPGLPEVRAIATDPVAVATAHALDVESILREHLETHPLITWVRELALVRDQGAAEVRMASLAAAVLLRRLGGSAEITDAELTAERGTLVREPLLHGFRLSVKR